MADTAAGLKGDQGRPLSFAGDQGRPLSFARLKGDQGRPLGFSSQNGEQGRPLSFSSLKEDQGRPLSSALLKTSISFFLQTSYSRSSGNIYATQVLFVSNLSISGRCASTLATTSMN